MRMIRPNTSPLLLMLWLSVFLAIPFLSINGRALQHWVRSQIDTQVLALLIIAPTVLFLCIAFYLLFKTFGWRIFIHLLWSGPLFLGIPLAFPIIEERLHFLVFGTFGFLSVSVLPRLFAAVVSISIAFLDELLQWVLPERVGDWRDIAINTIACLAGIFLAQSTTCEIEQK